MDEGTLIRAWVKAGSPPLEDLGALLGCGYIELVKVIRGDRPPTACLKAQLSEVFNLPIRDLFPRG